jgi:hypothetical protein
MKIEESSQRAQASGARDSAPVDEFDFLGVEHFGVLLGSHFELFFPDTAAWMPEARRAARAETERWLKVVTNARNVTAHSTTADLSPHNALEPLWAAMHVLHLMHETDGVAQLDRLIGQVFRLVVPSLEAGTNAAEPPPKGGKRKGSKRKDIKAIDTKEIRTFDEWMLAADHVSPDDMYVGLIRFFQGLADFHDDEDRAYKEESGDEPWGLGRGPEKVALALQEWWLGLPEHQRWEVPDDGEST